MNSLSAGFTLPVGLKSLDGTEHSSAGKELQQLAYKETE